MFENDQDYIESNKNYGVIDVHFKSCNNNCFRKEIWTGKYAQMTVMSIPSGGEIGLEYHDDLDQILIVEYGACSVYMGNSKQEVKFVGYANCNSAIIIPAGTWHNVINEQGVPLKLFSVYAPPKHPIGTVHNTKFDSDLTSY